MAAVLKDEPRRRRREETRQRLMEAAISVFAGAGFERATLDEIVRQAGFSKGAFYVYFESKDDLLRAMLEERISHQLETFRLGVDHSLPVARNVRTILGAVFGLVHLPLVVHVPPLAVLGIILGWWYWWTGSLWQPVLVHAIFNAITLSLLFLGFAG